MKEYRAEPKAAAGKAIAELMAALRVSEGAAYHNAHIKRYPDGGAVVTVFDRAIMRERGLEDAGGSRAAAEPEGEGAARRTPESDKRDRAQRRAKAAVYDLARCNDLGLFLTLTVSPERADRYDAAEVLRHLRYWLDNAVRRRGLVYVLIPELHKDGAVHFHALTNEALELVDSGTVIPPGGGKPRKPRSAAQRQAWLAAGGVVVYNVPGWSWGYSTAIRLYGDRRAAVGYVVKYITKAEGKIGGRWYYSGGKLKRPVVYADDLDFTAAAECGHVFDVAELGCRGVKIEMEGDSVHETMERLSRPSGPVLDTQEQERGEVL